MTFRSDTPPSDLAHFTGSFSGFEVGEMMHFLQMVEEMLDLPSVPAEAGALWTVVADRDGLAAVSRLGVSRIFAGGSFKAAIQKVETWVQEQGDRIL